MNREEDYIEKQLEGTLPAEVTYLVSLVETEFGRIESELAGSPPPEPPVTMESVLKGWRDVSSLVRSPFLLSPRFEILWPRGNGASNNEQLCFLRWRSDFLTKCLEVPVYENIVLAYKDEIIPARR